MRMDLSKLLEKSVFKKIALSLLVSLILFGITVCVNLNIPPRVVTVKEDIPFLSHPVIRTHIGKKFLALTCFLLPIAIFAVVEYILDEAFSLMQILLFASTILLSINITYVVTATLKIAVGRLRPNFYELCSYDKLLEKCTASKKLEHLARKSFPSGHSAIAFSSQGVVFCYLKDKLMSKRFEDNLKIKFCKIVSICFPLVIAGIIAASRMFEQWHFLTDVIFGG
ncbi:hypothetical protein MHBO_000810 [Bonamia ostreae]|uniref:Phosphatidic acid phosphatase type 2/haloperoxidase domain-containing protein n=1 Tax=Bonamia ostreae TaxID=126728 RepID=A0ABV2AGW3_9EUKA